MSADFTQLFSLYSVFIVLVLIAGFYCIIASFNLVRALIGIEILMKAVTLLIIIAGYVTNNLALAQALVISLIVIEVVLMVVAGGLILWIFRHNETIDTRKLNLLKG
ncbi:MAG: NADH-quinone oxidoreductase subunit K [Candidatus Margulisiibacteriota bacterium]